jgi:DnaK suppressor protein
VADHLDLAALFEGAIYARDSAVAQKPTGKKSSNTHKPRTASKRRGAGQSAAHARSTSSSKKVMKKPSPKSAERSAKTPKPAAKPVKAAAPAAGNAAAPVSAKPAKPAPAPKKAPVAGTGLTLKGKRVRTVAEAASNISADAKGYVFINGRRVRMITIKAPVTPKKVRDNGVKSEEDAAAEAIAIKSIKTKLSKKELNHYRDLLLLKRRELVGDLRAMENEALRSGGGNLSHMPIHMADIGTDTYDQDFMLGLAANERDQLREIDAALQRIEDRSYGVCQLTGKPIPKARLDAKPWAKYTIEAARKMESQWGR